MTGRGSGSSSAGSSSPTSASHRRLPPLQTSPTPQQGPLRSKAANPAPLLLTVRFSTSIPDLLLDIPHPGQTTIVSLKHLIRSRLEQPNSQRRLRFIHGGRILPDTAVLGATLKPLPPPPQAADPKGKGKGVAGSQAQRIYVICSIGDSLTDAELEDERRRAAEPASAPAPDEATAAPDARRPDDGGPRGFDRYLAQGVSAAEVHGLHLQFRSNVEALHTADTMPSPDTLRDMEDRWIENNNGAGTPAAGAEGAEGGAELLAEEAGLAGVLDLLLKGMFVGFIWPLGAVGWLVRDEEKIPKRMRVFVYFGFILSLLIGTIRTIG